jgi:hypothetical protein
MGVALSFSATLAEAGQQREIGFRVVGPPQDLEVLTAPPFAITLPQAEDLQPSFVRINALAAIGIGLITFNHEGLHQVKIEVDGELTAELSFVVIVNPSLGGPHVEPRADS